MPAAFPINLTHAPSNPVASQVGESSKAKEKKRGKMRKGRGGSSAKSPTKAGAPKKLEELTARQHAAAMLLFQRIDQDGSAVLDQNEVKQLDSDAWRDLDANGDGEVRTKPCLNSG